MAQNNWIIWIACIGISIPATDAENLAQRGNATQIDTYHNGIATNAIDGNRNSDFHHGGSCTHTSSITDPWWRVDLKDIYVITSITVVNQNGSHEGVYFKNRLRGAEIRVGNSLSNNGNDNPIVANITDVDRLQNFTMPDGVVGQFVNVFLRGHGKVLTLCEVEVYGHPVTVCPDDTNDEPPNHVNCSNHDAARLLMPSVSSLFIAADFSQAFCHGGEAEKLGILAQNTTFLEAPLKVKRKWPGIEKREDGSVVLHLSKWLTENNLKINVLTGENCAEVVNQTNGECKTMSNVSGPCTVKCLETNKVCKNAPYDKKTCLQMNITDNDKYFVNVTANECINCNNPVKKPKVKMELNKVIPGLPPIPTGPGQPLNSEIAENVMSSFTSDVVDQFNESVVALTLGESVTGVLVKQIDPENLEEVSFGYTKFTDGFSILEDRTATCKYSKSLTVSKEAFEKAKSLNISDPFAAVFSFLNMSKDEYNSSVLGDEVIAVEVGAMIRNLADTININFLNQHFKGIPSCRSWNGNGSRPVWISDGCETKTSGPNITCRCTHMTFFAVLLTPLNETISVSNLSTLTIITRVGCGLSMFFLGIVLFMHCIWRRTTSSNSTKILIQLVLAMFLLDFAFLVNDFVAKTKNVIGCKIMAAAMHYFMLSTFTWFAVHAFHLCLQVYRRGTIQIRRYILKISITSWVMPSVIAIVLLSIGKYGEVVVNTGNTVTNVAMCWILDNDVHYIVNISYYALVFLFTFSTFVLMLTWLCCLRRSQKAAAIQGKNVSSCQRIVTIMGLCCILGVTWGCAFFAYGIFRLPAYYCFTILNSFQGFCLFIYYYKSSRTVETKDPLNSSSSTNLDEIFNPYNYGTKPKPE